MNLAVDFANYTPVPSQAEIDCLKSQGYTKAIVGTSFGSVARAQLEACLAGGLEIETFTWLRWNDDWKSPIDRTLATINGLPIRRIWIDCEDATRWSEAQISMRIWEAEAYIASKRPDVNAKAIYTGGWWWRQYMPTTKSFASWDLWTADYVNNPVIPPQGQPRLYGGWTKAAIWQYAGSVETCGLNTDRNVILEEAHMPTPEYEELFQRDEDIKKVLGRVDSAVKFIIRAVMEFSAELYGDQDARTQRLKERVDALEKEADG